MAAPFVGKNDYRGYLSYLGSQGNAQAKALLGYVGNDAKFGGSLTPLANQGNSAAAIHALGANNQQYYQQFQQLQSGGGGAGNAGSIYGGGGGAGTVYAPRLDVAAISAQARQAAENAVNPYYTKTLNDFLTQQAAQKQQHQTQYETDIKNLQEGLTNTLQGNEITRGRAGVDEAQKQADINLQADNYQTDQGQQFDTSRRAQGVDLAKSGLTTSGIGQQKVAQSQDERNLQESRQGQQFQTSKDQAALLKGRSLEDLMRSDELSKTAEVKGEKQATFDLNNYIQNLGFEEQNKRNSLEQERLQRIGQEQGNQAKLKFTQYLAGIKNPAQYAAAVQTYGGLF